MAERLYMEGWMRKGERKMKAKVLLSLDLDRQMRTTRYTPIYLCLDWHLRAATQISHSPKKYCHRIQDQSSNQIF